MDNNFPVLAFAGISPEVVDAELNLGKMTRDIRGILDTHAMTDAVIEQCRERFSAL